MSGAKKIYWTISTLIIIVGTFHYSEVFLQYEHKGIIGTAVSWTMGLIFDAGLMLFLYYYGKMESASKHLIMIVLVSFTLFFQYEYYSTIAIICKRVAFSSVWPFMIVVMAYLGKKINGITGTAAEEETEQDANKKYSTFDFLNAKSTYDRKTDVQITEQAQKEDKIKGQNNTSTRRNKSKISHLWDPQKQAFVCPTCKKEFRTHNAFNPHKCGV